MITRQRARACPRASSSPARSTRRSTPRACDRRRRTCSSSAAPRSSARRSRTPQLRYVYLTRVDGAFGCDIHIPDLDALGFVRDAWDGEAGARRTASRYRIERLAQTATGNLMNGWCW